MKKRIRILSVLTALVMLLYSLPCAAAPVLQKRYTVGDVDLDDKLNIVDATAVQRSLAGLSQLEALQRFIGDVDHDGSLTILDATIIQRKLAEIADDFWRPAFNVYSHSIDYLRLSAGYMEDRIDRPQSTYVGCPVTVIFSAVGGYMVDSSTRICYDVYINSEIIAEHTEETRIVHVFDKAGVYTITVRSGDIFGLSDEKSTTVTILESPETPYVTGGGFDSESNSLWVRAEGGAAPYQYKFYIRHGMVQEPSDAPTEPATDSPSEEPTFAPDPLPSGVYALTSEYIESDRITVPVDKLLTGMTYYFFVQIKDSKGHETPMIGLGSFTPTAADPQ